MHICIGDESLQPLPGNFSRDAGKFLRRNMFIAWERRRSEVLYRAFGNHGKSECEQVDN
jgi:hypothetical protein